jgi:hypothetical protein
MVTLLVVLLVLALVCWLISILPIPASPFPIKTIAYVIVGIIAIVYLLRFAGIA